MCWHKTDAGTSARMGPGPAGRYGAANLLCSAGQPQFAQVSFCGGRRQRVTYLYQGNHRNPGPLWLPQSSRYARAGAGGIIINPFIDSTANRDCPYVSSVRAGKIGTPATAPASGAVSVSCLGYGLNDRYWC